MAASLRCQASSVVGVTGKIPVQRRRGMNRVSAVNHARSAGSVAWSPRNIRTARLKVQRMSR